MRAIWTKLTVVMLALLAVVMVYILMVRPWLLNWGATAVEQSRALPGDEIVAFPAKTTTRALTIGVAADKAFPWLAQLGQNRGGFYSFELLEDLVGCEMPRAETLLPGAQEWLPGDQLWMYPYFKLDGAGGAPLVDFIPGRALAFATWNPASPHNQPPDGSWAFVIEPIDASTSRFLVRGRGTELASVGGLLFDRVAFEPIHFIMERRMMEGIERLAEGRKARTRLADTAEIAVWAAMLALFFWGLGATLWRERWIAPYAVTLAAAVGFLVTTLFQPPAYIGLPLAAILGWVLWRGRNRVEMEVGIQEDRLSPAAAR
jgi:hypothetical protein